MNTKVLESGAALIQSFQPLKNYNVYLVGFHPMKDHPHQQMIAYHYCKQVNEDFMQCILFDNNNEKANLTGVEYIVSEKLFNSLPSSEKKYWHPHNYEILSGGLIAPAIPDSVEKKFLSKKMNSYGKTWHLWMEGSDLPLGEAELAWSFNRDGEVDPKLVKTRDDKFNVSTKEKRQQRQDLVKLAKPQSGVNDLKSSFPHSKPVSGVEDIAKP